MCKEPEWCTKTGASYCCAKTMTTCFFNRKIVDIKENELGIIISLEKAE